MILAFWVLRLSEDKKRKKKAKRTKNRYNFLIDSEIYSEFSSMCEEEGLVRGKQVELMMAGFIKRRKEGNRG